MDVPDGMDKSWDHPWSTEEMRKKRREWSLAGDAGLLKHLQQFSENLTSRASKTQEALDSLNSQLNETAILIDNVTNASLALANTQFIESRVQEDDVEIEKKPEESKQDLKDQDPAANLIATVSESVRQGLSIMDEKYRRMEVVDSDSEDEDDDIVLSVILGPNDPYQDRPLPYVIGSDKWKTSNKIGLESSSSESEQVDEEEESESEKEESRGQKMFDANPAPKINQIARLSSSSSESDNYNNQSNNIAYISNGKLDGTSQSNTNSVPESTTPINNVPKTQVPNEPTSNFAEELAKRLGTVRQGQKPVSVDEPTEASINRLKDDLFTPEDENAVTNKSGNVYNVSKELFDDQVSSSLWKEKPIKPFKNNIIPASIDVPPPITTVSTKPKSAIDDLFGDPDSEDSDDIFSSKTTVKKITKDDGSNKQSVAGGEAMHKKFLDIVAPTTMTTSTPENNTHATNLFSDEDDDDNDLFGTSKKQSHKSVDTTPSTQDSSKKKPVGGISILGSVLSSDIESKLSSRLARRQSSGSSGSDTAANYDTSRRNESVHEDGSQNAVLSDTTANRSSIVASRHAPAGNSVTNTENSSGISIQPPSINNTASSSMGEDFQPQMTSTRYRSEEIFRERIVSDSLLAGNTRDPANANSNLTNSRQERNEGSSSNRQDDVFENEDLFGPPPLPKADSKPPKSKVSSLFDDSDSGDELFSTTSSGSRSQKSTDFLATTPQYTDKNKSIHKKGLFDEEIDIFGNKDVPDVDIFGIASKPSVQKDESFAKKVSSDGLFGGKPHDSASSGSTVEKVQSAKPPTKKISLFDDDDVDDGDLFSVKPLKNDRKSEARLFKENEDDDLFSSSKVIGKEQTDDKRSSVKKDTESDKSQVSNVSEISSSQKTEKKTNEVLSGKGLFSSTTDVHGNLFEDDEYDDLFGKKSIVSEKTKADEKPKMKPEETLFKPIKETQENQKETAETSTEDVSQISASKKNEVDDAKSDIAESSTEDSISDNAAKKSPPKTLSIQGNEENAQAPRRTVSGKIKNLMGKMGDLKILSPMDTPPLWRKSEEKTDEEDDIADRDSDDGGCVSTQSRSSPISISESSALRKQSPPSTSEGNNAETAISFDEPAQVETLSTAASKSRVRIQAKRRPQSRHARKSAIRQSGIDFDTVDSSTNDSQDDGQVESSSLSAKESSVSNSANTSIISNTDRAGPPSGLATENVHRATDTSLAIDDKSELGSLSKESSMNKNTLLSPSTDEEDLFDVPPELPEDPQKEDTLFGRAPILSPVEDVLTAQTTTIVKPIRETAIRRIDTSESDDETTPPIPTEKYITPDADTTEESKSNRVNIPSKDCVKKEGKRKQVSVDDRVTEKDIFTEKDEVIDPLRDSSHDPLKDPSQLFAFVTKTPSPEKGKNLLFSEDDSLFTSGSKKVSEERTQKKQVLDLFADDAGGDLFSAPLAKSVKKPLKDTKISLFDEDSQNDEDDNLFGSTSKKVSVKSESQKSTDTQGSQKKTSLFDDDDDDTNLFSEHSEQSQKSDSVKTESSSKRETSTSEAVKTSKLKDIFGDQSSGEEDIFAAKKIIPKKVVSSKSLFPSDDEDDGHIFGKGPSSSETMVKATETRPSVKKAITRDLKKTAEKIVEDPLSILKDE